MSRRTETALPFRGEYCELLNLEVLRHRLGKEDRKQLLGALLRDPHLAELDRDLHFAGVLAGSSQRFNEEAFLRRARRAIAAYVRRARATLTQAFTRDESNLHVILEQKIIALANALTRTPRPLSAPLRPSQAVKAIFGREAYSVSLSRIHGVRVLYTDDPSLGRSRYAWRMSTSSDRPSRAAAVARPEVGRAVFVEDVDVDPRTGTVRPARGRRRRDHIRTCVIVKGIGTTKYAHNRFSHRTSGVMTLPPAERDWQFSEILRQGGVPVYHPLELSLLPYCDWHPQMGWRPMVAYARLPLEPLRVSDLDLLPDHTLRSVVAQLRAKVAASSGVPARTIMNDDVVRFFVARLGRISGLCEAGRTFGGRPFFHGFLHLQNVSLLGELVDLGEGRFVKDDRELRTAYAKSGYVNPTRAWTAAIRHGRREAGLYHQIARRFARVMRRAMDPPARGPRGLHTLFWRCHREGRAGLRADCAPDLLQIARELGP